MERLSSASGAYIAPTNYLSIQKPDSTNGGAKVQVTGHRSGHRPGHRPQVRLQITGFRPGHRSGHRSDHRPQVRSQVTHKNNRTLAKTVFD